MIELFWTPEAVDDREAIFDYIEKNNPIAALNLMPYLSVRRAT